MSHNPGSLAYSSKATAELRLCFSFTNSPGESESLRNFQPTPINFRLSSNWGIFTQNWFDQKWVKTMDHGYELFSWLTGSCPCATKRGHVMMVWLSYTPRGSCSCYHVFVLPGVHPPKAERATYCQSLACWPDRGIDTWLTFAAIRWQNLLKQWGRPWPRPRWATTFWVRTLR